MRRLQKVVVFLLFVAFALLTPRVDAQSSKHLSPFFKSWIDEYVPYIITQAERKEFLSLHTDDERDSFIKEFWTSRNPDPHSSINTFKEEHYRRLAYVRDHFGDARYNDGWRTDMGRIYITLGPPQQTAKYHQGISTRPVEIWFYQSPSPALPPYFNLVFFKPSEAEPYILYSPRQDGPTRIVTNDAHDDAIALHTIDQSMGGEAEQSMVSLIPSEPVDFKNPSYSSLSDTLLNEIRSLPEQKLEKDRVTRLRQANNENITVNIFTGAHALDLQTLVVRDDHGQNTVNFLLRYQRPDLSLIGVLPNKATGYSMTLKTRVTTASGKAIYERDEQLGGTVSAAGAAAGKEKIFAAEGRLPLVPGNYSLETVLTNNLTHDSTRTLGKVTVPAPRPDNLGVSGLMVYRDTPLAHVRAGVPFTLAGVRFDPRGEQTVEIHAGEQLPLVYQIWLPQREPKALTPSTGVASSPKVIHVHYLMGQVNQSAVGQNRVNEDEELEVKNFDRAGNLLNGHTLNTAELATGTYRLVVTLSESGSPQPAYATMIVRILPSETPVMMWSAYSSDNQHPASLDDLYRGLAADAQGDIPEAEACYKRVLVLHPGLKDAQLRLDALSRTVSQRIPDARH